MKSFNMARIGGISSVWKFKLGVKMAPSKGKKKETEEVEDELGPKVREGAERSGIQDDNHTQVIKWRDFMISGSYDN